MTRERGEWCDVHDDWFPSGCYRCRAKLFLVDPTPKELRDYEKRLKAASKAKEEREYEKRYAVASKEAKCPSFRYYDYQDDDPERVSEWWKRVKHVRWNPTYLTARFTARSARRRS